MSRLREIALREPADTLVSDNQGSLSEICRHCGAKYLPKERHTTVYTLCCSKGKVLLDNPERPPQVLIDLYTGLFPEQSETFLNNIRGYNSSLAFASMNCRLNSQLLRGPHNYCFRIHGQVYHLTSSLHPPENRPARYGQLYIYESERAERERTDQANTYGLDSSILLALHRSMEETNPLCRSFRTMRDIENRENMRAENLNITPRSVFMNIRSDRTADMRRFNPVSADEVAAFFTSEDGTPPDALRYEIVILPRPNVDPQQVEEVGAMQINGLYKIQRMNPNCDPMVYPLLFPYGEQGWRPDISHTTRRIRNTVTPMEFYSYRLQIRDGVFETIQRARKLFHQYVVDAYTRVESYRLQWLRNNQADLRVELYQGLLDYLDSAERPDGRTGRRFILPSTFIGSPRNMQQNFQDAMSMVRELGKPDLFITVTCNPKWSEITSALFPGQKAIDRPDIVCRVFDLKLREIIRQIYERGIFGVAIGYVYTIEFQKRGLPHAHILVILHPESKARDPEGVDRIVCAEIPDPETHPNLYNAVASHMIHGPCGVDFPNCPCMENEICTKKFPKSFVSNTLLADNAFPTYRRRDNGSFIVKRGVQLDNRHVVPYNKYLLLKFNAHINVEFCASVSCVKYIYKYIYKGYDCANVEITDQSDEIQNFLTGRYVSAAESIWRIYGFKMHHRSHTIIRLAVHLENCQQVVFQEGFEDAALERAQRRRTTLTGWFDLNLRDAAARRLLYAEIPVHYLWEKSSTSWQPRQMIRNTIGRMYFANPRESERFFLRILLLHCRGATSFEFLRTHNGVLHNTYKEAAISRGLASDDSEWERALNEASVFSMPNALRSLFATITVFCNPTDSLALFEKFVEVMSEDFLRNHSMDTARQMCLKDLNCQLKGLSMSNVLVGLPEPDEDAMENEEAELIDRCEDVRDIRLNEKQREVFDAVVSAVRSPSIVERYFFVDGPGGSGKTTLYRKICRALSINNKKYICVASTGIAANLLPNGRTAHSVFKIPLNVSNDSVSSLNHNSQEAQRIREADLIVWDEATMSSKYAVKCASNLVSDVQPMSE